VQIRPTTPGDTPTLVELVRGTGVFKPLEVDTLDEVLTDYHAENLAAGHRCATGVVGDRVRGFVYFAPAPMTEGAWHLWWIAVEKTLQARGTGGQLLRYAEDEIRRVGGRVLFIETSSLPHYEPTRRFYLKHDYELAATLRDFYAAGDHMVVFRKVLC
jgi:GNAT superfamily N-acetyltransferase